MAILKVTQYGEEILRKPTQLVTEQECKKKKFQQFLLDMVETMYTYKGVGLAAPQVNSNKRVTVIDTEWLN